LKLLFDQNLPPRLVTALAQLYPGSEHVRNLGLASADDLEVWNYAKLHGFVIASKDSDFHQRSFVDGAPPKSSGCALATARHPRSNKSCGTIMKRSSHLKVSHLPAS